MSTLPFRRFLLCTLLAVVLTAAPAAIAQDHPDCRIEVTGIVNNGFLNLGDGTRAIGHQGYGFRVVFETRGEPDFERDLGAREELRWDGPARSGDDNQNVTVQIFDPAGLLAVEARSETPGANYLFWALHDLSTGDRVTLDHSAVSGAASTGSLVTGMRTFFDARSAVETVAAPVDHLTAVLDPIEPLSGRDFVDVRGSGNLFIRVDNASTTVTTTRYAGGCVETDDDDDGVPDEVDNCPQVPNPMQIDLDGDGLGDACDACPFDADNDLDADGVCGDADNCPEIANPDQEDLDGDLLGDACDPDVDDDGFDNGIDNCPRVYNPGQEDFDGDLAGDACDPDLDGDGVDDAADLCVPTPLGDAVRPDGCAIADLCPCEGQPDGTSWRNHGAYVSCVSRAAEELLAAGLITEAEKDATVSAAGGSACGHRRR